MADWAVTFLLRGEEGNRLADGRSRTLGGRDATDQRTGDGTEVTLRGSGFMMGEALDDARQRLGEATELRPESLELMGAVRVGGRYLVGPRMISTTVIPGPSSCGFSGALACGLALPSRWARLLTASE